MAEVRSFTDIVDELDNASGGRTTSIGDIVDTFGSRGFGALLAVPALISISPLGALPGASGIIAVILILIAAQLLVGRDRPWLPGYLRRIEVGTERFDRATGKMRPWTRRIDRLVGPRLEVLVHPPADRIMALAVVLLALSFFPVILIPWAVVVPSVITLLFAVALVARDGYAALAGWIICPLWLWALWQLATMATPQ